MEKRVNFLKLLTNGNTFVKLLPFVNRFHSRVKDVQVIFPAKLAQDADEFDKVIWHKEYKKREKLRRLKNKSKAFALALSQCSLNVINKFGGQTRMQKN